MKDLRGIPAWAFFTLVIVASVISCATLRAQTDPGLETGLKPFGVYEGGNIDFVSTTTGKLHLHIPLLSYPQRGGKLHLNYFIDYDSAITLWVAPPAGNGS
jgi:hypothetical protein